MTTQTNVTQLKINTLTAQQYAAITPNENELYMITDEAITSSDVTTALGYTPENRANKVTTISASSTDTQYPSAKCVNSALNNTLQVKGAITSSTVLTTLAEGIYMVDGITHSGFPDTTQAFYGVLVQFGGTYKPQMLVAGLPSVGGIYHRRYLTASSTFTNWVRCGNAATGSNSFTMGGTPTAVSSGTNVGISSQATGGFGTAFGYNAKAAARATSIGFSAISTAADAIQIGNGTNSTATALNVGFYNKGNYKLLDGETGKIPSDRLNIVTSVSASSTNAEIVGAKLFYDTVGDIETLLQGV